MNDGIAGTSDLSPAFAAVAGRRGDCVAIGSESELAYVNAAGRRLTGLPDGDLAGSMLDLFWHDDRSHVDGTVIPEVRRRGSWSGELRLRDRARETPVPVAIELFEVGPAAQPGSIAFVAHDLSSSVRSEARTRMLVGAGAALSNSLDPQHNFEALASLVVRSFATYCVIDVFSDRNVAQPVLRVATDHVDRAKRRLVAELERYTPDLARPDKPIAAALLEGTSMLMHEVDPQWIDEITSGPEHAAILRDLGLRSWMTVPLVARGKILGALTCGLGAEAVHRTGLDHGYEAEDLFFAEELGRRAGTSIDNARLYEYQRNIAVTLQAAALPVSLPHIDHLRLTAEYRPGSEEATIGGDWYDAFELRDGRVVLTVGDVQGHGLQAAVTMTKLRQAMQSAAMVDADPAMMLEVADRTLALHDPDGYATGIAAIFDPMDHSLVVASAGHPSPVVRTADGRIEEISVSGTMLGVHAGIRRESRKIELAERSMVVLFTDGLIEATRDIEDGHVRLIGALERLDSGDDRIATSLVDAVLGDVVATDDIAVLCIRVASALAPEEAPVQAAYASLDGVYENRRELATAS